MLIMCLALEIESYKKEIEILKRKENARGLSLEDLESFSRLMILMMSQMKDHDLLLLKKNDCYYY